MLANTGTRNSRSSRSVCTRAARHATRQAVRVLPTCAARARTVCLSVGADVESSDAALQLYFSPCKADSEPRAQSARQGSLSASTCSSATSLPSRVALSTVHVVAVRAPKVRETPSVRRLPARHATRLFFSCFFFAHLDSRCSSGCLAASLLSLVSLASRETPRKSSNSY